MGARSGRRLAIALAVVVTAVVAVFGARWWDVWRHPLATNGDVITLVERGEGLVAAYNDRGRRWLGQMEHADPTERDDLRSKVVADMRTAAQDAHAQALVARHDLEALRLPPGSKLAVARDAYRDLLNARIDNWAALEMDLADLSHGAEVNAAHTLAVRAFAAVSLSAPDRARIDAVLR